MRTQERRYGLGDGAGDGAPASHEASAGTAAEATLQALSEAFDLRREPPRVQHLTYFDSFDERVWKAGGRLAGEPREGGGWHLRWTRPEDRTLEVTLPSGDPGFPEALPAGAFRTALAEILDPRRLLPRVEVQRREEEVRVLGAEEKTVVRLVLETGQARAAAGGPWQPLEAVLRLQPVLGYGASLAKVRTFLEEERGLEAAPRDGLVQALAAVGEEPGSQAPGGTVSLTSDLPAAEALRQILLAQLGIVEANLEGTRSGLDVEFLHDLRVAVRRSRSALSQLKGVLDPEAVEPFRRELARLGRATGPTRDLDVYLLKMPRYRQGLPRAAVEALQPLQEFLEAKHQKAQLSLARTLGSKRTGKFLRDYRAYLEGEPAPGPEGERPLGDLAGDRLWKAYRKVLKKGKKLDDTSPAEDLHDLRIRAKKLRYLLEFFGGLAPQRTAPFVAELKRVQDNLGDFNDYEVQQDKLTDFAQEMAKAGQAPTETLLAMGRLLDRLDAGWHKERQRFAKRFKRFSAKENRQAFRALVEAVWSGGQEG